MEQRFLSVYEDKNPMLLKIMAVPGCELTPGHFSKHDLSVK